MQARPRVALSIALGLTSSVCAARAAEPEAAIVYPVHEEAVRPASSGQASNGRPRFDDHPFYLELRAGLRAVGAIGVAAEYDVADRLALGAGLGSSPYGSEYELNARYRPLIGVSKGGRALQAFTLEGTLANGKYAASFPELLNCVDGCDEHTVVPQRVFWAQLEIGWELRFGNGMTVRTGVGGSARLGNYHWQCPAPCYESNPPARLLLSGTAAWGIAF